MSAFESAAALAEIEAVVLKSAYVLGGSVDVLDGYENEDALRRILGIARRAMAGQYAAPARPEGTAAQSSVTLTLGAKGETRVEVKAYEGSDLAGPVQAATTEYDRLVHRYVGAAKVGAGEGAS